MSHTAPQPLERQPLERNASPWLFLVALATTLPHFAHQPIWLISLAALMLLWAAQLWWQRQALPQRWLLLIAVVTASSCVLIEFRSLFGREAGVALLVLLMAMKLLEMKTRRDAQIVITLGYFLLLTHYLYSQSIPTGLWLLACFWLITASQIRLHGGAASTPVASLRYAGLLTLQALPFMLLFYLLFPRISGPLWGLPEDAHAGRSGLSEQMSPGSISNLVQNGEIAFHVKFTGDIPAKEKLYWRGPVLEIYDGQNWRPHAGASSQPRIEAIGQAITYESTLESHNQRWLLALDAPTPLSSEQRLNDTMTLLNRSPISERQRFRLQSSLDYRFNREEAPAVLQRNLNLPNHRHPQATALGRSWLAAGLTPPQRIQQALQLFAGKDYSYTLQPPLLIDDTMDEFLFQSKQGFCEHYASAFVVLMRAAGVPARVVTGYQGGELNPVDNYLVVRQSDAHAWAEVWLAGHGWQRIDPTAVVAPSRIESGINEGMLGGNLLPAVIQIRNSWLRSLHFRWAAINNAWNQKILGYDSQRQREFLARLGFANSDWQTLAGILASSSTLLMLIVTTWTLWQRNKTDPALRLWQKALHRLARRKVNCAPWETPLAIAKRLETECPTLAAPFREVVDAYLKTRYGNSPHDLKPLRKALSQLP